MKAHSERLDTQPETHAGQAVYSPLALRAYDAFVLGLSCQLAWGCPASVLLDHYTQHVGSRHVDVGVGSGYLLDHCRFPVEAPEILLVDLNPNSLAFTARRIARYRPRTLRHDVYQPVPTAERFDSAGLNFLIHCLPGTLADKATAIANVAALLRPGGTLFGSTILGNSAEHNLFGASLMALYNRKGIFSNRHDTEAGLRSALEAHLVDVVVTRRGRVALFSGKARNRA